MGVSSSDAITDSADLGRWKEIKEQAAPRVDHLNVLPPKLPTTYPLPTLFNMDTEVAVEPPTLSYDEEVPYEAQVAPEPEQSNSLASRIGNTKVYLLSEQSTTRAGKVRWQIEK